MLDALPTIADALASLRRGALTSRELVEHCLERVERCDSDVRAWVHVDAQGAREAADRADELRAQRGSLGLLDGIPVGVKDIVDMQGLPTKAGSPLRDRHVADRDATVVIRLRQQGAIVLGKTVTTQFACFDPSPTRNPRGPGHTPGGSSSGSAAATAAEMCLAAIGSQTGGSIIRPAAYCGVVGLKPTFAAIPVDGVVPVSPRLDHVGAIARNVADTAAFYAALANVALPPSDRRAPPRIGVIRDYFFEELEEELRQATETAIDGLQRAGAAVHDVPLPASFGQVHQMHWRIMAVDAASYHRQAYAANPDAYGRNIRRLLDDGLRLTRSEYEDACRHQQDFTREAAELFADADVLLTPAAPTTAPADLTTTGDPRWNSPFSYSGQPAIAIPCGVGNAGMPCGLQLVAARDSDHSLLAIAGWCERALSSLSSAAGA